MESGCRFPSLEAKLQTVFTRRPLFEVPVTQRPREGTDLLIMSDEFLGTNELRKCEDPEVFLHKDALGLNTSSESWWVASHGRWCP